MACEPRLKQESDKHLETAEVLHLARTESGNSELRGSKATRVESSFQSGPKSLKIHAPLSSPRAVVRKLNRRRRAAETDEESVPKKPKGEPSPKPTPAPKAKGKAKAKAKSKNKA